MPTPLEILLDPVSLAVLAIYGGLVLLEALFPARRLPRIPGWHARALAVFAVYFFLSSYLPLLWGDLLAPYRLVNLESVHPLVGAAVGVLVFEFLVYVWHRAMHKNHWLWRAFHQMHHSAERVDSFGAFYFSPLDIAGFALLSSLTLTAVGLPAQSVTWYLYATMFLATFQHTNVRTPQWLGYIVQRPESHSVHHGRGIHHYNYSDLPLFDVIFGTFRNPKDFVAESGFEGVSSAQILDMLACRDVAARDFEQSVQPATSSVAHSWKKNPTRKRRHRVMNRFNNFAATALTALALAGSGALHADPVARHGASKPAAAGPTVTTYATGLTNPRGLTFGPDGLLYVAEAGVGGENDPADIRPGCPDIVNVFSPYKGGYSGRVLRVRPDGTTETVADNLPSTADVTMTGFGPTDLAFLGGTLYVLIEMGGCTHGLPEDLPAILRVNPDGSTTNVANLNAWLAANPPFFINDNSDPTQTDFEPGGVFHSMFADGRYLYVVETNRGMLLRVDPRRRTIERVYDMSIDRQEHNPIVMTRRGNQFFVGTFGEDGGPAELAQFDKDFTGYTLPFQSLNPIVGLAWHGNRLYGVEMFPYDNQWAPDSSNLVTFDPRTGERREVLTAFASYAGDMVKGPDGALYVSNQVVSFSFTGGDGSILRIVP